MGPKILVLTAVIILVSCVGPVDQPADRRGDSKPPLTTPAPAPPTPLASDQISFLLVKEKVLVNKCLGCHADVDADHGGLSLEEYKNVFQNRDLVLARIMSGSMPMSPAPPLTSAEKDLVEQWLKNGAREFAAPGRTVF